MDRRGASPSGGNPPYAATTGAWPRVGTHSPAPASDGQRTASPPRIEDHDGSNHLRHDSPAAVQGPPRGSGSRSGRRNPPSLRLPRIHRQPKYGGVVTETTHRFYDSLWNSVTEQSVEGVVARMLNNRSLSALGSCSRICRASVGRGTWFSRPLLLASRGRVHTPCTRSTSDHRMSATSSSRCPGRSNISGS